MNIGSKILKQKLIGLIHKVYTGLLKKKRKYLAHTKTKSEVRGGGRKPWRQKGTGQARAGSIRSPIWRGGGVTFGPRYHITTLKINKKEKKKALFAAFLLKKNAVTVVDNKQFEQLNTHKTKNFVSFLQSYNISNKYKTLIIVKDVPKHIKLATQNLYFIKLLPLDLLNLESIMIAKKILVLNDALTIIKSTYGQII